MYNVLFHRLKGFNGWSSWPARTVLDVQRITGMWTYTRKIRIFDRDKKYELTLEYYYPQTEFIYTQTTHVITARYQTEQDMLDDVKQIHDKQEKIKLIAQKLVETK